jgi:hypothetical protein
VARAIVTAMRVVGNREGKGGKAMAMGTRVAGKRMPTATMRAMVTKTREAGNKEGNGKGGKSNGNGEEEGNSKKDSNGIFSSFDVQSLLFGRGQTKSHQKVMFF